MGLYISKWASPRPPRLDVFLKTFVFCSGIWYKSKPEMLAYINICGDDDMMTMMPRMRGIVFLVY